MENLNYTLHKNDDLDSLTNLEKVKICHEIGSHEFVYDFPKVWDRYFKIDKSIRVACKWCRARNPLFGNHGCSSFVEFRDGKIIMNPRHNDDIERRDFNHFNQVIIRFNHYKYEPLEKLRYSISSDCVKMSTILYPSDKFHAWAKLSDAKNRDLTGWFNYV